MAPQMVLDTLNWAFVGVTAHKMFFQTSSLSKPDLMCNLLHKSPHSRTLLEDLSQRASFLQPQSESYSFFQQHRSVAGYTELNIHDEFLCFHKVHPSLHF